MIIRTFYWVLPTCQQPFYMLLYRLSHYHSHFINEKREVTYLTQNTKWQSYFPKCDNMSHSFNMIYWMPTILKPGNIVGRTSFRKSQSSKYGHGPRTMDDDRSTPRCITVNLRTLKNPSQKKKGRKEGRIY